MHVVIIGGGIIGLACGYALRRRGAEVTVLDQGKIGAATSCGNAGWIMLSLSWAGTGADWSAYPSDWCSIRLAPSASDHALIARSYIGSRALRGSAIFETTARETSRSHSASKGKSLGCVPSRRGWQEPTFWPISKPAGPSWFSLPDATPATTGKKQQRGGASAPSLLAGSPPRCTRLAGALDHAVALLERVVDSTPTTPTPSAARDGAVRARHSPLHLPVTLLNIVSLVFRLTDSPSLRLYQRSSWQASRHNSKASS